MDVLFSMSGVALVLTVHALRRMLNIPQPHVDSRAQLWRCLLAEMSRRVRFGAPCMGDV